MPAPSTTFKQSRSSSWCEKSSALLCSCIIKHGFGSYKVIMANNIFPGKTKAQLTLQLQKITGQQSLAEYQGLHIDPVSIGARNALLKGVKRRGGFIVHEGDRVGREEVKLSIERNKRFEVDECVWRGIVIAPMVLEALEDGKSAKIARLEGLGRELEAVRAEIKLLEERDVSLEMPS